MARSRPSRQRPATQDDFRAQSLPVQDRIIAVLTALVTRMQNIRLAQIDKNDCPAQVAHIQRFVIAVQYQYFLAHPFRALLFTPRFNVVGSLFAVTPIV